MAITLAGLVILILVLMNAWATRAVLRDNLSTNGQLAAQVALVWLLPFLGALLTLHFKRTGPEASAGRYSDYPNLGEDSIAAQGYRSSSAAADSGASSDGGGGSGD